VAARRPGGAPLDAAVTPSCHSDGMEPQLALLECPDNQWRLDERTRRIGREGVQQARRALQDALHQVEERPAA
jgi:hypothetical protein